VDLAAPRRGALQLSRAFASAAAVLLAFAAPAAAEPGAEGRYRLRGEQDVASELIIRPGGTFAYFLAAGALDEQAEGRWRREGAAIFLTTEPKPVPAAFSAGDAVLRRAAAALTLRVVWPDGRGVAGVDLRVGFAEGGLIDDYTQEDGWSLPPDERRIPAWIELSVPMHGLASPRFPVEPARANDLTFVLTPNDLGTVDFADLRLDLEPGRLLMRRAGGTLRYERTGDVRP
jgi:hypothetical protein